MVRHQQTFLTRAIIHVGWGAPVNQFSFLILFASYQFLLYLIHCEPTLTFPTLAAAALAKDIHTYGKTIHVLWGRDSHRNERAPFPLPATPLWWSYDWQYCAQEVEEAQTSRPVAPSWTREGRKINSAVTHTHTHTHTHTYQWAKIALRATCPYSQHLIRVYEWCFFLRTLLAINSLPDHYCVNSRFITFLKQLMCTCQFYTGFLMQKDTTNSYTHNSCSLTSQWSTIKSMAECTLPLPRWCTCVNLVSFTVLSNTVAK